MSKSPLPKAVRRLAAQAPAGAPVSQERLRFRRLIDPDEIESLVTSALLAEKPIEVYVDAFCAKHGYTAGGVAASRVRAQVEQVYKIRQAQAADKKK